MVKVHDSVVVKPGVIDPDFDTAIGGWQGRVAEIDVDNDLFLIEWDSVTLRNMLDSMIEQCEVQAGLFNSLHRADKWTGFTG